ncbi:MAG TPA: M13 family metallopeptidase, partial [Burkholderiaceae bacterium]
MKRSVLAASLALALSSPLALAADAPAAKPAIGDFGVDLANRDASVKPGDDFNRYASGKWLDSYQLKDYETRYGAFNELADQSEKQTHEILEDLLKRTDLAPGSNEQKLRDYYLSYMNQAARDAAGIAPLKPVLAKIAHIDSIAKLTAAFGESDVDGTTVPVGLGLALDRKNPDAYLVTLGVGGLGLPDKDYYLNPDPHFAEIRAAYVANLQTMLGFAGVAGPDAKARAQAILDLETSIAKNLWDRAELRNRDKTYNVSTFADLQKQYPGYDFAAHLQAQGMGTPDKVNVSTPSAVAPVFDLINKTPLNVWRDYLTAHAVANNAGLLSQQIDQAAFAFYGTVLRGQKAQKEPWKRAMATIGDTDGLGDALGQIYVARYFKPESKAAMDQLVANLRVALRQNIDKLDWMGPETKAEAYKKLDSFHPKIGYPNKWRDYSSVTIVPDNLVANVMAMRRYYQDDQNARLGKKTDRDEWFMTPQTVNAYYNSTFNEIVFPAAILQPPFFDVNADPAV